MMKILVVAPIISLSFLLVQNHGPPDQKAREIVTTAVERAKENDKIEVENLQFKKRITEYDLNDDQSIKKKYRDDVFQIYSADGELRESLIERMGKSINEMKSEKVKNFGGANYIEILQEILPNNFDFSLIDEEMTFEDFVPTCAMRFYPKPNIKKDSRVTKLTRAMEGKLYIDVKSNVWRVEPKISQKVRFYWVLGAVYEAEMVIQQRRYGDIVVMDYIDARVRFRNFLKTTHRRYIWKHYDYKEHNDPAQ